MEVKVEFSKSNKVADVNYIKLGIGPKVHVEMLVCTNAYKSLYNF